MTKVDENQNRLSKMTKVDENQNNFQCKPEYKEYPYYEKIKVRRMEGSTFEAASGGGSFLSLNLLLQGTTPACLPNLVIQVG